MKSICSAYIERCSLANLTGPIVKHYYFAIIIFSLIFSQNVIANSENLSFHENFANLILKDQFGISFDSKKLQNKVVLFNFVYTQCSTTCPLQTQTLSEIIRGLPSNVKSRVMFISVSLDPINDTPEKLTKYIRRYKAHADNWLFITGSLNDIAALSDRLNLYGKKSISDDAIRPDDHTTHLWLVDREGRLMMRYKGNPIDKSRVAREIEALAKS